MVYCKKMGNALHQNLQAYYLKRSADFNNFSSLIIPLIAKILNKIAIIGKKVPTLKLAVSNPPGILFAYWLHQKDKPIIKTTFAMMILFWIVLFLKLNMLANDIKATAMVLISNGVVLSTATFWLPDFW